MHGIATCSLEYQSHLDFLYFAPAVYIPNSLSYTQSHLTLWIDNIRSPPGTLYSVFIRADASGQPKFEIVNFGRVVQVVQGRDGENQFAYAFTTPDTAALVSIYCSGKWIFKSAMLMTGTR